jgi:hypothetical protein
MACTPAITRAIAVDIRRRDADTWLEIDAWAADGDAGLPARPAPLSPAVVAAILESGRPTAIAQRFASIPISGASHPELASLAGRLLPELLSSRWSN